jgi:heme-degrading monooxygenase HmoA
MIEKRETNMLTIGLYYDVLPHKAKEFEDKFFQVLDLMKGLPGHKESFLYHRVDDPNSYAIIGEWDTQESFTAFVRSDAFKAVTTWGREQILRGPPRHKVYPRSEEMGRPAAPASQAAPGKCPVSGHGG